MSAPLILLVEDDAMARGGYAELLELDGFRVAQAGSAEDALSCTADVVPDAVVTDLSLPGEDGFTLAQTLRAGRTTAQVPVLAMTAHWSANLHDRAQRLGISSMLMKPCQPAHLIAELRRALVRRVHAS